MVARELIALAFLVGFCDYLVVHLSRPRLRNAFVGFMRMKVVFLLWAVAFGILSALAFFVVLAAGSVIAGSDGGANLGAWVAALLIPLALGHLAVAWPARGRFGDPNQRIRLLFPHQRIWDFAGSHVEGQYGRCLEHLAQAYASVPWDEASLARMHTHIIPRYRGKRLNHRVNPRLLTALKTFRDQRDVFAFFYAILEEFGPRSVDGLLAKL